MKPTKAAIRETIQRAAKKGGRVNELQKPVVTLSAAPWDQPKEATK